MDFGPGMGLDSRLMEELLKVKSQSRKRDQNSIISEQELIEKEANYVDEVILRVGKRKEASKTFVDSISEDFWLSLTKPGFIKQLSALFTAEDRVAFLGKYFAGVNIPP